MITSHRLRVLILSQDVNDGAVIADLLAKINDWPFDLESATLTEFDLERMVSREHEIYLINDQPPTYSGLHLIRLAVDRGCVAPIILIVPQRSRELDLEAMNVGAADCLERDSLDAAGLEHVIRYAAYRSQNVALENARLFESERFARKQAEMLRARTDYHLIHMTKLYEQVRQQVQELEIRVNEQTRELRALYELAQALGHVTQIDEVIRLTFRHLHEAIEYDVAAGLLSTDTMNIYYICHQRELTAEIELQIQTRLFGTLPRLKGQSISSNTLKIRRYHSDQVDHSQPPLISLGKIIEAPIQVDQGPNGMILVATEGEAQLNQEQERLIHMFADQASKVIGRLESFLAAEHHRLEQLVAHLPDGVILLDADLRIVLANQAARELMVFLTNAEVGDKLTHLDKNSVEEIVSLTYTGRPFTIELEDAGNRAFQLMAKPITAGPEVGGWMLVIRDITGERTAQKHIQQQQRMAAVGQLAAGIAHDFNNILTSIIGFTELLLIDDQVPPLAKSDLERISSQANRAAQLVRQILDFSSQTITEKHPLDLAPFLKETIKLLERTIPEDIHISLDIEPGDYIVSMDVTQIQQVLTNLAVNARDAMPDGGDLQFRLSRLTPSPNDEPLPAGLPPEDWVVLAVSDTGIGIPPEFQNQIFEPFFTTKEIGKGTGLGLAQVYGIVQQHEGHIHVRSQLDAGTTFTLYFPAYRKPFSKLPSNLTDEIPLGNSELLLFVEDDASVLQIAKMMLTHLNYRVLTAPNGHDALKLYQQHQDEIDLVLTDMTMPKMGGAELALTLRERNPAVKVLGLTGYPLDEKSKEVLESGILTWLKKPINLEDLAQTLHRLLQPEPRSL